MGGNQSLISTHTLLFFAVLVKLGSKSNPKGFSSPDCNKKTTVFRRWFFIGDPTGTTIRFAPALVNKNWTQKNKNVV